MQNPHCTPPQRTNDSAICWRCGSSSPSSVVIDLPSAFSALSAHASTGLPSMSTVQQPHCACGWQPSLGDVMPSPSRNKSSSVQPDSGSENSTSRSFTRQEITPPERGVAGAEIVAMESWPPASVPHVSAKNRRHATKRRRWWPTHARPWHFSPRPDYPSTTHSSLAQVFGSTQAESPPSQAVFSRVLSRCYKDRQNKDTSTTRDRRTPMPKPHPYLAQAKKYEKPMVAFLRDMVEIPSESGHEREVIERIKQGDESRQRLRPHLDRQDGKPARPGRHAGQRQETHRHRRPRRHGRRRRSAGMEARPVRGQSRRAGASGAAARATRKARSPRWSTRRRSSATSRSIPRNTACC